MMDREMKSMSLGGTALIAVEGSHGTGKSTLVHGLTARLKERSVNVAALVETARRSPFVEELAIHRSTSFSLAAQLQLFCTQLAEEQLLARHHEMIVADCSVVNALGYARLLPSLSVNEEALLIALEGVVAAYAGSYDVVFYLEDRYELARTNDPYRLEDEGIRARADIAIRAECEAVGLPLVQVPVSLSLQERLDWAQHFLRRQAPEPVQALLAE